MDASNLLSQEEILQLVSLREVFGGFSHEIAQPLNAIMLASQIVQLTVQRSPLSDDEKSYLIHRLDTISSQVQRATQIVETIRGLGQRKSTASPDIDLKACFETVYGLMEQQFVGRGVKFTCKSEDPLPLLTIDTRVAKLILVQGLAFARSVTETVGKWHDEKGISFDRQIQVELKPETGRSVASITWSTGELPSPIDLINPSTHVGLLSANSVIKSFGGDFKVFSQGISITFP